MEYTDEEIITMLEICTNSTGCINCPLADKTCMEMPVHELDLIKRQREEIEKLNAENMLTMSERNAFRTAFYGVSKQLKTAKSEFVKEFADRLKNLWYDNRYDSPDIEFDYFVDNLVKEMTQED